MIDWVFGNGDCGLCDVVLFLVIWSFMMNVLIDVCSVMNMISKGQVLILKDVCDVIGFVLGQLVCVGINDQGQVVVMLCVLGVVEILEQKLQWLDVVIDVVLRCYCIGWFMWEIMVDLCGDELLL